MPRRRKGQREKDMIELSRRYLHGEYMADIAIDLGVSSVQVGKDLKELRRRWIESALVDFDTIQAQELAKIDELERTYWQAWEDSKQQKQLTLKEKSETPQGDRARAQVRTEERLGDPRYLQGIQWCIGKRCEIFGLDAARKIELDWRQELEQAGYDAGDTFERLVQAAANTVNAE